MQDPKNNTNVIEVTLDFAGHFQQSFSVITLRIQNDINAHLQISYLLASHSETEP